jgi:hypothetical protein
MNDLQEKVERLTNLLRLARHHVKASCDHFKGLPKDMHELYGCFELLNRIDRELER